MKPGRGPDQCRARRRRRRGGGRRGSAGRPARRGGARRVRGGARHGGTRSGLRGLPEPGPDAAYRRRHGRIQCARLVGDGRKRAQAPRGSVSDAGPVHRRCGGARRGRRSSAAERASGMRGIVAARPGGRRGRWAQGSRPVAGADLCRSGQGRTRSTGSPRRRAGGPSRPCSPSMRPTVSPIRRSILRLPNCLPSRGLQGVAAAAIRRSHHCGAAGHPVERLAEAGLVADALRQYAGGHRALGRLGGVFGTNPIAFACPLPGRAPVVVDLSLSKVARGNILAAKQKGEADPGRLGARRRRRSRRPIRMRRSAAPCCRSATPRARRWP